MNQPECSDHKWICRYVNNLRYKIYIFYLGLVRWIYIEPKFNSVPGHIFEYRSRGPEMSFQIGQITKSCWLGSNTSDQGARIDNLSHMWTPQSTRIHMWLLVQSKDSCGEAWLFAIGVYIGQSPLLQLQFDVCKLIQCFLWLFLLSRLSSRAPSSWSRSFQIENHYHYHNKNSSSL